MQQISELYNMFGNHVDRSNKTVWQANRPDRADSRSKVTVDEVILTKNLIRNFIESLSAKAAHTIELDK